MILKDNFSILLPNRYILVALNSIYFLTEKMLKSYSYQILRRLLIKIGLRKHTDHIRKDVEIIRIQPNLKLIVYWKVLHIGKGPAVILQAYNKEILKFDCFGKDEGHYHAAPDYEKRIFFEEETVPAQINRTAIELKENAQSYLKRQEDTKIQNIELDRKQILKAVDQAEKKMIFFLETIPELKDLR